MIQQLYIIYRKMNIVQLSEQLGNISDACRKLGVSRQHYYDTKADLQEEGVEGLLGKVRTTPRIRNRVAPETEERVLQYALEYPTHDQVRVANELKKAGITISPGGVRSIWLRHSLEKAHLRLKRLEKWAAENNHILTESQVRALEEAKEEKEAQGEIETCHPGFLVSPDTFYVGRIKGIGKIYQQTGIDTF
jgi:hypothetical protein